MADDQTSEYGFVLPEVDGSDDSWGDKLNGNWASVDAILAGHGQRISGVEASAVPAGLISMWSGTIGSIPTGWAICDGTNGTPDLRGRFVVGAGGTYSVGEAGGEDEVTLTAAQMPSHDHTADASSSGAHSHTGTASSAGAHNHSQGFGELGATGSARYVGGSSATQFSTSTAGAHTHSLSINSDGAHTHDITVSNAGGGEAHENRPPYYALAYIMKL